MQPITQEQGNGVKRLKLLTWNIRHGGAKKKINDIIQALLFHNPDIMVITEFRDNENGNKMKSSLKENGWVYQKASNPNHIENSILVASKIPFSQPSVNDYDLPEAEHRWNEIYLVDYNLSILGIHIPSFNEKWDKQNHWDAVIAYAKKRIDHNCVIIGDFNTGLKEDTEGGPFRFPEYMEELNNIGWVDSWRVYNTNVNDFTWYSHAYNGFRLDYAYLSPPLENNLLVSYHSHRERINKYSDHSILIAELIFF